MKNPHSLVARVFKARYYQNSQFLQAKVGNGSSFIWSGIITTKNTLSGSYRWVLGDGKDINAIEDNWLRGKPDFRVNQDIWYNAGDRDVSNWMLSGSRVWDVAKVNSTFVEEDAKLILATRIPQNEVKDRIAWTTTTNGQYSVKSGYHLWHGQNVGTGDVIQSNGWGKIWKLTLPHKVKVFFWRFCKNNIPVRNRLRSKGVSLPILCPMCEVDVEHLLHIFFDCSFAKQCWSYVGCVMDMLICNLFMMLQIGSYRRSILLVEKISG